MIYKLSGSVKWKDVVFLYEGAGCVSGSGGVQGACMELKGEVFKCQYMIDTHVKAKYVNVTFLMMSKCGLISLPLCKNAPSDTQVFQYKNSKCHKGIRATWVSQCKNAKCHVDPLYWNAT